MGLRARIVFCLPATGLTGSGLSEQPTLESRTNCDTADGHLPDVAEANTIVIALILQEASEDSIAQGLAFVNSKNLLILKKKNNFFTFYMSASWRICLPAVEHRPLNVTWETGKRAMAEEEKGREIWNIFISFLSSSFYGLFTGRCFLVFFLLYFWHQLCWSLLLSKKGWTLD